MLTRRRTGVTRRGFLKGLAGLSAAVAVERLIGTHLGDLERAVWVPKGYAPGFTTNAPLFDFERAIAEIPTWQNPTVSVHAQGRRADGKFYDRLFAVDTFDASKGLQAVLDWSHAEQNRDVLIHLPPVPYQMSEALKVDPSDRVVIGGVGAVILVGEIVRPSGRVSGIETSRVARLGRWE